jgi:hypothetical protein
MRLMILIVLLIAIGVCYKNTIVNHEYAFIKGRKTVDLIAHHTGIIKQTGTTEHPLFTISDEANEQTYFPYNLDKKYQQNNLHVYFSGNIKEMAPLEDEYGIYFEVTAMN